MCVCVCVCVWRWGGWGCVLGVCVCRDVWGWVWCVCVCACLQKEFLTGCFLMVSQVWWTGVWMKLIVSLAIFVSYMFCYFDCFGILNCKIVVIQLLVYAAMTVFNKPLMKWNEMKWTVLRLMLFFSHKIEILMDSSICILRNTFQWDQKLLFNFKLSNGSFTVQLLKKQHTNKQDFVREKCGLTASSSLKIHLNTDTATDEKPTWVIFVF